MKRYRICQFDFDTRAHLLEPVQDHWEEHVKELHIKNQRSIIEGLRAQYGEWDIDVKIKNFRDLKIKPLSVLAFHNKFLEQIRNAYVMGSYYPALTGSCALGERILNHMILLLREYNKDSLEYKKVFRKDSFDFWPQVVDALENWGDLLPAAASTFRNLNKKRNRAIHFNPEIDRDDQSLALEAIHLIQDIVDIQFSAFNKQPWCFYAPGEAYIKKEWEERPFVKNIFVPNSLLVGPNHSVESVTPEFVIKDQPEYEDREISNKEFTSLRKKFLNKPKK